MRKMFRIREFVLDAEGTVEFRVMYRPDGWFSRWEIVGKHATKENAELDVKVMADYPHVVRSWDYDHDGRELYQGW